MQEIKNKTALITGGSKGTGFGIARSDIFFYTEEDDVNIIFKRDPEGKVNGFKLLQNGEELEVPKLPPFDPTQVDL